MSFIAGSAPVRPVLSVVMGLNLDGFADCRGVAGRDHQVSPLGLANSRHLRIGPAA